MLLTDGNLQRKPLFYFLPSPESSGSPSASVISDRGLQGNPLFAICAVRLGSGAVRGDSVIPQQNEMLQTMSALFPGRFGGNLTSPQMPAVSEPWLMGLAPGSASHKGGILLLSRKIGFGFFLWFCGSFLVLFIYG